MPKGTKNPKEPLRFLKRAYDRLPEVTRMFSEPTPDGAVTTQEEGAASNVRD